MHPIDITEDVFVSDEVVIPADEIQWRTLDGSSDSAGVEAIWRFADSAHAPADLRRELRRLTGSDRLVTRSDDPTSAWQNRLAAMARMTALVRQALGAPGVEPPEKSPLVLGRRSA